MVTKREAVEQWHADQERRNGSPDAGSDRGLMLVQGDEVATRRVAWLWRGRVPLRGLTIAAGPEKLGKSTALIWLAARTTRGELPGDFEGRPMTVAYVSGEDDAESVLVPRMVAAGADLQRVLVMNPDPDAELFAVEHLTTIVDLGLVVLDPLSMYLDVPAMNEHGEGVTRNALRPFVRLAQQRGLAVTGVRHLNKGWAGGSPFDAIMGSRAFSAAARSILLFTKDVERPELEGGGLIFARGNLAAAAPAQRYALQIVDVECDDGSTSEVPRFALDEGIVGVSLEAAMQSGGDSTQHDDAVAFLLDLLGDGPVDTKTVQQRARDAGLSWRRVERAKTVAGVKAERVGGLGAEGRWQWRLAKSAGVQPIPRDSGLSGNVAVLGTPPSPPMPCRDLDCRLTADASGYCYRHREEPF